MQQQPSPIGALLLDGKGGAGDLDWPGVRAWRPADGLLWVHLWRDGAETRAWLKGESGLDAVVADALLPDETRPRCVAHDGGVVLNLRGVNLNPGAEPEDMVSVRLWIEPTRIVSVRLRRLMAVHAMQEALRTGRGVRELGEFLVSLVGGLLQRMEPVIAELGEGVDGLEEAMIEKPARTIRAELSELRRQIIALRRYVAPQREALAQLIVQDPPWLRPAARSRLREVADGVTRIVEELDATRERAAVVQDELAGLISERMERAMFMLGIVATIFLPLGLITGLLGINVGGIPGTEEPWAFAIVCAILAVVGVFEYWLFRRLNWI